MRYRCRASGTRRYVGFVMNSYLDLERIVSLLVYIRQTIPKMSSLSDHLKVKQFCMKNITDVKKKDVTIKNFTKHILLCIRKNDLRFYA